MAKYRVWAECISDVYLDVEADSEKEARAIAEETDGSEFTEDGIGDWRFGSIYQIDEKGKYAGE